MSEPLIERREVEALLFAVIDIAETVSNIERWLKEDGSGETEADEG